MKKWFLPVNVYCLSAAFVAVFLAVYLIENKNNFELLIASAISFLAGVTIGLIVAVYQFKTFVSQDISRRFKLERVSKIQKWSNRILLFLLILSPGNYKVVLFSVLVGFYLLTALGLVMLQRYVKETLRWEHLT